MLFDEMLEDITFNENLKDINPHILKNKIIAIESKIKGYTNNDFVSRNTGKVEYPNDVKEGIIKLLEWEFTTGKKIGVKSESISRHSITYFDQDSSNTILGYPSSLVGFLRPYMRARF